MKWTSALAIYVLFWSFSFFLVLPFRPRVRGAQERKVPGQADSGFGAFSFGRACLWTTLVSAMLFGLYYANYVFGWLGPDAFDFFPVPVAR